MGILDRYCLLCGRGAADRSLGIQAGEIWRLTSETFPRRALELRFWRDGQVVGAWVSSRQGWMDRRSSWAEIPHAVMGTWRIVDGTLTLSLPSEVEIAIQIIKSTPHYAAGMDERRSACELTLLNDHRFVLFAAPDRRKALLLVNAFKSRRHITAVAEHLHPQHPLSVTAEVRAARRVFVIWSQTSIRAQDVLQYALPAYHAGTLVPVLFDRVTPPAPFHGLAAADLTSWNGDFQHPQLRLFLSDIEAVIPDLPERRLEAT